MKLQRSVALLCVIALSATMLPLNIVAQQPATAKRPITHQDYDSWRSLLATQVSRDGKFVAYAYVPQDGDGEIVVRNIATGVDWRASRGYRPPAPPPDDPGTNVAEFQAEQARLMRPVFTADSKFIIFGIEPGKAELNKAKKDKKKPEDMPKNGLGIMDLANGTVTRAERVKNFRVPEDGPGFFAYLLEPKPEEKPKPADPSAPTATEPSAVAPGQSPESRPSGSSRAPRGKKKEYGSDLVLRNTSTSTERNFSDVLDFTISKDAKTLVFAHHHEKKTPTASTL